MWDTRYATTEYVYGTQPNDFLKSSLQYLPKVPNAKILCLAEGEGRNAVYLAEHGFDVYAVDSSVVGLAKAQKLAQLRGVEITTQVADLADFELGENQWDGIVSIFCHLPSPLRQRLHQKVNLALKPQGVFILEAYRPDQLDFGTGGPPNANLMMDMNTLREELAELQHQHLCEVNREIEEGTLHSGMSAVVQMIAIKTE